jgi:hypothetical protein
VERTLLSAAGTLRAECLDVHSFATLTEAKQVIEDWRREYNESRPHRSLGERTPSEFACQIALNGGWPTLSLILTPEGGPSLSRFLRQGGDFDFLSSPRLPCAHNPSVIEIY